LQTLSTNGIWPGEEPEVPAGNLVLDLLAGARLAWTGPATAEQTRREVERQAEKVRQDGGIPHVIPYGGSNSYAAQAYVDCSGELRRDHGRTGRRAWCRTSHRHRHWSRGRPLCRLNELRDGMPDVRVRRSDPQLDDGQVGAGYAAVTPPRGKR